MEQKLCTVIAFALLCIAILVQGQDVFCKDSAQLCQTVKDPRWPNRCNETVFAEKCQLSCNDSCAAVLAQTNTTSGVLSSTTTTTTLSTTTTVAATKQSTTNGSASTTTTVPATATSSATTMKAPETTTAEMTSTDQETTTDQGSSTDQESTTQVKILTRLTTKSTNAPSRAELNLKNAVQASERMGDTDYNLDISVTFLGNVSSDDVPTLTQAVESALSEFPMSVEKIEVESRKHGHSETGRFKLTAISWKLKVNGKQSKSVDDLVKEIRKSITVGFLIEQHLPTELDTSVYGGTQFVEGRAPTDPPSTTTEKVKDYDSKDWEYVGITVGAGLGLIVFIIVSAVVMKWKRQKKQGTEIGQEGGYDIEVTPVYVNNNAEEKDVKTSL